MFNHKREHEIYTKIRAKAKRCEVGDAINLNKVKPLSLDLAVRALGSCFSRYRGTTYMKDCEPEEHDHQLYDDDEVVNVYDDTSERIRVMKDYPKVTSEFIHYIARNLGCNDANDLVNIWESPTFYADARKIILDTTEESYSRNLIRKAKTISYHINDEVTLLDIGTEDPEFLDRMEIETGLVGTGLNIEGYVHYTSQFKYGVDSGRIKLYDGINIPFDDKFDLVTILAVIHHIPPENMPKFAESVARVCNKTLIIKDNDLIDDLSRTFAYFQHSIYEGGLVCGSKNYMNYDVTAKSTLEYFKPYFNVVSTGEPSGFARSYWAKLMKK